MSTDDDLGSNLAVDAPVVVKRKAPTRPETVRLILEENEEIPPTGLFVGLNGRGYLIRPGEEVTVPYGVAEILEHAVTSVPQMDPQTRQVVGYRDRMRYSFRRLG
jgi:hypothetical protein